MAYLRLPDGSYFRFDDHLSDAEARSLAQQKYPGAFAPTPPECQQQLNALPKDAASNFILLPDGSCFKFSISRDTEWAYQQARQERPDAWQRFSAGQDAGQVATASPVPRVDVRGAYEQALFASVASVLVGALVLAAVGWGLWRRATRQTPLQVGRWWAAQASGAAALVQVGRSWRSVPEDQFFNVLLVAVPAGVIAFALGWSYAKWGARIDRKPGAN